MKVARIVGLSLLVVAAPIVFAGPGAAAGVRSSVVSTDVTNHQFLTANIGSGSECNPGHTSHYDCLHVVNNEMAANPGRFEAVSIDEACATDADNFGIDHPGWVVFYTPDIPHDSPICGKDANGDGISKGNFVASPFFIGAKHEFPLTPLPGGPDTFTLTCGQTLSTWFCTVHLPYLNADQIATYPNLHKYEVDEIWQAQESLPGNFVVAGDFNMQPTDSSDSFWRFHAHNFQETDPTNQPTTHPQTTGGHGVKFDYIWYHKPDESNVSISGHEIVSQPYPYEWTDPVTGDTQLTGYDHNILEGGVDW